MLDQSSSNKWLGCMLSTVDASKRQDDIDHRLQCAARAFHVNKWILCDKMVSMASRLRFSDAMITSVVCFATGRRKIYANDLRKLVVHCRKLFRRVVGPPPDIDWNQRWHTILHGTTGLINNWNTMVSRYGRRNTYPSFGNSESRCRTS